MAHLTVDYYSQVLGMDRTMSVILPELSDHNPTWTAETLQDVPVLYLLHGMSGDQSTWQRRTDIERLVRQTPVAIIMPSTDLAWYTNTQYGLNYFDAIAKELPEKVASFFPQLSTKRSKNFVVGLSMGGYGAFKMAFATDKFSYASSLSGALVGETDTLLDLESLTYWRGIFGDLDHFIGSENDILTLAERCENKPKLYDWIGEQDEFKQLNDTAVSKLKQLSYDITYETAPGRHEWYYWDKQIERVLEWLPINYVQEERLS
ncbi:esterase family protein [Weissella paramesenteroides]|uniref:alpha/beta hydrolase n=1 Tax=Weissella paramesenteroides TaxID=1249 RepID=UPI002402D91D|nr:alpha/beta hydrolase family protein [Weissella paramesenteroides]MDF8367418.1 esterase family protein [Weissella paramesenteroides]